jgi:hypothetical protein
MGHGGRRMSHRQFSLGEARSSGSGVLSSLVQFGQAESIKCQISKIWHRPEVFLSLRKDAERCHNASKADLPSQCWLFRELAHFILRHGVKTGCQEMVNCSDSWHRR